MLILVAASTSNKHDTVRGWGLVAAGVALLVGGLAFIPILRARDPDSTSKYIPQGSEGFKVVLSVLLAAAGFVMIVAGAVQAAS
jgi:hypothetical protein